MVFIYDPDALDRLTDVEGEDWRKLQDQNPANPYGFHAWKLAWAERQRVVAENSEYADEPVSTFLAEGGDGAIYGDGGWNRYVVMPTGELILLAWSARQSSKAKAAKAGVSVS